MISSNMNPIKSTGTMNKLDFTIHNAGTQGLEVKLPPKKAMISFPGSLVAKSPDISMTTTLGDNSPKETSLLSKAWGGIKRIFVGERINFVKFKNESTEDKVLCLSSKRVGQIVPIELNKLNGQEIICKKGAFLCKDENISVDIGIADHVKAVLFGKNGILLQKLKGDGAVFINGKGVVIEKELKENESLDLDKDAFLAMTKGVDYNMEVVKSPDKSWSFRNMLFGGEGMFLINIKGPGKVWYQADTSDLDTALALNKIKDEQSFQGLIVSLQLLNN